MESDLVLAATWLDEVEEAEVVADAVAAAAEDREELVTDEVSPESAALILES